MVRESVNRESRDSLCVNSGSYSGTYASLVLLPRVLRWCVPTGESSFIISGCCDSLKFD